MGRCPEEKKGRAWPPTRMKLGRPWGERGELEALIPRRRVIIGSCWIELHGSVTGVHIGGRENRGQLGCARMLPTLAIGTNLKTR